MDMIDGLPRIASDVEPGVETVRFEFPGREILIVPPACFRMASEAAGSNHSVCEMI
jgi:hypothetical protein